ncbi:MAG: ribosome-binding factor A [Candidatus Lariskella arthropodorum]|uniref:ribosome-binding factor A n=1 Tax=Candidatus Lariskella endosymbiont of Epinotia ramella TaxID=3066224 RepID=UPI0030D60B5A
MNKNLMFDSIFFEKKAPSNRQLRVSQAIKNELSIMLVSGALFHPEIENTYLTIAHVKITPDLRLATIYIAVHDDSRTQAYLEALRLLVPNMRRVIGSSIRLKYTPEIKLRSVSYAESIVHHT